MRVRIRYNHKTLRSGRIGFYGASITTALVIPALSIVVAASRVPVTLAVPRPLPPIVASIAKVGAVRRHPCLPLERVELDRISKQVSRQHGVDARIIRAMVEHESRGQPCLTSSKGAVGLLQLMPRTASHLGVKNLYDPEENVEAGIRHLRQLLVRYKNDLPVALAAYNAGIGKVDLYGGVPPLKETQSYVADILRRIPLAESASAE